MADNLTSEWSKLFQYREAIHERYREVWDIPLTKNRRSLLKGLLKDGMTVLDVGGGLRGMKDEIAKMGLHVEYKSMDIDRGNPHDYYDLADIKEQFDVVLLFEVIEHVSLENCLDLLKKIYAVTKEKGIVIVSTPNIFNPSRYMRDSSHVTFYAYDELCGLISMAGFHIRQVNRSYNDAIHRYFLKVYLFRFLFRFLSIDYANSIFATGEKVHTGSA